MSRMAHREKQGGRMRAGGGCVIVNGAGQGRPVKEMTSEQRSKNLLR